MANSTQKVVYQDGYRNANVRFTGSLDTSNLTGTDAVVLADFTNNDPRAGTLRGLRIDKITAVIMPPLSVQLFWNATTPQLIGNLAAYDNELEFVGGLFPTTGAAGYTGGLNVNTLGWAAGTWIFTINLEMTKIYQ